MTDEIINTLIYIFLGLLGGVGHYMKKRFFEKSIDIGFLEYLRVEPETTQQAFYSIIASSYGLSLLHVGPTYHLNELIAVIASGYSFDSILNRTKN